MSREANIIQYLEDWHQGFYDSYSKDRDRLIEKTVENVLAYFDIAENTENIRNYAHELERLAREDKVIIRMNVYTDTWLLELP